MKRIFLLLALTTLPAFTQEPQTPPHPSHELTRLGMSRLEATLGIKFDRPFPVAQLDTDVRKRQPIALLTLDRGTVAVSRPFADIHDGAIEWMIGTKDIPQLGKTSLDVRAEMDESGEFIQVSVSSSPDDWTIEGGTSNITRKENETGGDFMDRLSLTYLLRAKNASDPEQARLLLSGFETSMRAIHRCRKEQTLVK